MNGQEEDSISRYFELVKDHPELFAQSGALPIVLDEERMRAFERERGEKVGLVVERYPWWLVVIDLCEGANGQLYSYGRVVYCNEKTNGAAALIKCKDKFGLLRIFRHGPRTVCQECPRGFHEEKSLSLEENIAKEISEELGIAPKYCCIQKLGEIRPDSGLTSGKTHVFLVEISDEAEITTATQEGILAFEWYTEEQFLDAIHSGRITDGFTLAAYALYVSSKKAHNI